MGTTLDPKTIATIKATVPVLKEQGEVLTRHFYQRMFANNPEVEVFFNTANQAEGTQQKALAGAICAYAENIDNLEVLRNAVELIAQKHAALQIKPEHYPIVGENLLASIREVLGAAANDEVIDAWAQAYALLQQILTAREADIYQQQAEQPHGWTGFKLFKIIKKEPESAQITSFYLQPEKGGVPVYQAGQYITVRVPSANGKTTMRNYSLSDKPGQDYFRISVKKEQGQDGAPDGYVSNLLHDTMEVGDRLEVGPPCGEFFLDTQSRKPLVLIAAGVGITPILSMLLQALEVQPERGITFIHGAFSEHAQAFKNKIEELAAQHPQLQIHYRYSEQQRSADTLEAHCSLGRINASLLDAKITERDADYYFCGPTSFMVDIYHALKDWQIPESQINFEFFGPRDALEKTA